MCVYVQKTVDTKKEKYKRRRREERRRRRRRKGRKKVTLFIFEPVKEERKIAFRNDEKENRVKAGSVFLLRFLRSARMNV